MWTDDDTNRLAGAVMQSFLKAGESAKLSKATLADIAGVSRARFTTLEKEPRLSLHAFLRCYKAVNTIQSGLDDGWLPAGSQRGPGQRVARDQILERL